MLPKGEMDPHGVDPARPGPASCPNRCWLNSRAGSMGKSALMTIASTTQELFPFILSAAVVSVHSGVVSAAKHVYSGLSARGVFLSGGGPSLF